MTWSLSSTFKISLALRTAEWWVLSPSAAEHLALLVQAAWRVADPHAVPAAEPNACLLLQPPAKKLRRHHVPRVDILGRWACSLANRAPWSRAVGPQAGHLEAKVSPRAVFYSYGLVQAGP